MPAIVNKVLKNSIAEELEIEPGDEIVSIDDTKMRDMIDYSFLCKNELITVEIKKKNEEIEVFELEKDYDEDLGIVFESAVFDKIKPCLNHCIFCFVDQQPKGLRKSLYVKDDDYRLSYLQGTYITLTNLTQKDKERISKLKLGPFYISVHTTNPELRVKMLRNPKAGEILENLKWLDENFIPVNLQIVLCPGYNDGKELERTLSDFKTLKNVMSVAIVPLGLTKFRKEKLNPVTKEIAIDTIKKVEEFNTSLKRHIACCSDEFFAIAQMPIPTKKYYGNFSQLEDGVGALRLLLENFKKEKKDLPKSLTTPHKILFATSKLAKIAMDEIVENLNKIKNLEAYSYAINSKYWGDKITVAGLITSDDLIDGIKEAQDTYKCEFDTIIIPSVMLRQYDKDFIDGKKFNDVKRSLNSDFLVIKNCYSTNEIVQHLAKL
jgi:putative radical SAM enzyme (TIGR03279 family)